MEMRKQIEQSMGQTLPPYNEDLDEADMSPEMEVQVSQMAAQAAQQIVQQHQQEAQQQKNQQMQQDPLIQLQQQELQLKQQDLQRKSQKDMQDMQAKMAQIEVEMKRIEAQQETEGAKLALQHQNNEIERESKQQADGFRMGLELTKHREQMGNQARQSQNRQPTKKGD